MVNKNNKHLRQKAQKTGRHAETLAAWVLCLKGYRILARNFRHRAGEIDIIACKGGVLVFVEVKQRRRHGADLDAVSPTQWQRIGAAAQAFVARHKGAQAMVWRFDFIGMGRFGWPRHLKAVWRF